MPNRTSAPRLSPVQPDAEALLRAVQEHITEAIFTVDEHGTITSWNKGAEQLLGYSEQDIVGLSCRVLDGNTCLGEHCRSGRPPCPLFAQGGIWNRRCEVRHASGRRITVMKNGRLLRDGEGRIVGGVETIIDVSSLVQPELDVAVPSPERPMIGRSAAMEQVRQLAEQAAGSDVSVLILGESGTGKELLAEAIHAGSARASRPLVRVDCSAYSESLLESELFGHARGAFTGAVSQRIGRFEAAAGGTIFLDEIGEVAPHVQKKLLRFLQSHEFERVGENTPRHVDVRVISATHRDVKTMVGEGSFREDLYWRLSAFPIVVPSLRERLDDVVLLAEHFLAAHWQRNRRGTPPVIDEEVRRLLLTHAWPGNCRELENVMWFAATVTRGERVATEQLPPYLRSASQPGGTDDDRAVLAALESCQWRRSRAAELLGISRVTLWRRMQRMGLVRPPER